MAAMERFKMFLVSLIAMCVLAPVAGVFLAGVHAASAWYYCVALFLSGLAVWRTMAPPSAGIRGLPSRSRRDSSIPHS
jgi:hypothetical protein